MKNTLIFLAAVFVAACNSAPPVAMNANSTATIAKTEHAANFESVAAHTTENKNPTMGKTDGKQSSSALGDPIDVTEFNAAIKSATKNEAAKPKDPDAKKKLGDAYFARGFALTQARQYAAALGDYRRTLKYDPDNDEAKTWIDQIESIYKMLKKEAPKEGEEPEPLPFKKQ